VLWNKGDAKRRKEQRGEQEERILGLKDVTPTTPGQQCKSMKGKRLREEQHAKLLKTKCKNDRNCARVVFVRVRNKGLKWVPRTCMEV
jgi:hypothetical protein